jgi:hypothetical protein
MSLGLAFKTFFRILIDRGFADSVRRLEEPGERAVTLRRSALTLLATLQREGRLVDFLQEDLDSYTDEDVGAAVRDIHRDCRTVVDRLFGVEPLRPEEEESTVDIATGFDPGEVRLTGNVTGEPPYQGVLRHAGWRATRCELPAWNGSEGAAMVVAAAEVEL